jgi:beta-ketoacyl-acyl-carrier-protein synthase II
MAERVVITGIGMISPLGLDVHSTWQSILDGKSGVRRITAFDPTDFLTQIASEAKGFDPNNYMDRKEARHTDRFSQLAIAASQEALNQAHLAIDKSNTDDIVTIVGSGVGGIITLSEQLNVLNEKGPSRVNPFLIPMMLTDLAAGQLSIKLGIQGPNFATVSACSSSSDAIGTAYEMIKRGDFHTAIAGGAEAPICPISIAGFNSCGALSKRNDKPEKASSPFDADRDGFIIGEGSTILILENMDRALKRGAEPMAELIGYGASSDAYHVTQPSPSGDGGAKAMSIALKKAGLGPSDIDYINAHGTSTPLNDKVETKAIKKVFGQSAYGIPISSTKSMTGHLLGASGALEAAFCILSIQNGVIPPTINLHSPDPECDLNYTPFLPKRGVVKTAMTNSLGFGGHNSTLIFQRLNN